MSSNLVTPIDKVTSTLNSHESGDTIAQNRTNHRQLNPFLSVHYIASRLRDVTTDIESLVGVFSDAKISAENRHQL